jgi:hypothetical protein
VTRPSQARTAIPAPEDHQALKALARKAALARLAHQAKLDGQELPVVQVSVSVMGVERSKCRSTWTTG